MKKQDTELLTFDTAYDFYKKQGLSVDTLDTKAEFSIHRIGEHSMPAGYKSPTYRCNFFSFVFFKDAGDEFPFLLSENVSPRVVELADYAEFEELYLQIHKAYVSTSVFRYKLIGHLFVALLIKFKEKLWADYNPIKEGDRSSEIVKRFKMLLEKHYRDLSEGLYDRMHRVTEYADLLNLHPNYLNTVIRVKTGKSVGNWISEKTIAEAKALLKNSDMSVKEISYRLGFAEIQNFSAYFKKHTNLSPVLFRQGA
ncbi:MAG TPA: AraC family transcriptional regulator [Puia sp.]